MSEKPNGSFATHYFAEMRRVTELLSDVYTPMEAQEWLLAKQPLLNGESPSQLIAQGRVNEVEQLIEAIRDGAFL